MDIWREYIIEKIIPTVQEDHLWLDYLSNALCNELSPIGIHLAIFVEPYLTYVLNGKKTIESRFGIKRQPPYGHVAAGDILLLKQSGGPIVGLCKVSNVWFYHLNESSWKMLREEFTTALCAQDPNFWKQRESAEFATLMQITSVKSIEPVSFQKNDRRGWVVLRQSLGSGSYL